MRLGKVRFHLISVGGLINKKNLINFFSEILNITNKEHAVITKTRLFKYKCILKISSPKTGSFQIKNLIFFFYISAQSIYCGYSLEPPRPTIYVFEQQ